jgi:ribose/xylose/arabinose/galactoside ABC-type transport system permease subunit
MNGLGKIFIILGIFFIIFGLIFTFSGKIPFPGQLPGDFNFGNEKFRIYLPIISSLLLSLLLTLILNVIMRLINR